MAITLHFEKRHPTEKPNALRRAGKLPAVFYGKKQTATPIVVSANEFAKVWKRAGESAVVMLQGSDGELPALIHDIDRDPVTDVFRHIDFYVFEAGQKLRVKVPIEFTGVAPAVKDLGGVLVKVLHELELEAEPKHLPQRIEVDISPLATFASVITAKEIALPSGVALITKPDEVVASVYEPKEEVAEETPAPDLSQIAVVKKGKEVTEGEADSTGGAQADAAAQEAKKEEKKEAKKEAKQ